MRAAVFDFDGVLVDSEPLHYAALAECLRGEGIEIGPEEYAAEYLAYSDREALRIAFERHGQACGRERVEAAAERKAAIFERRLPEVRFFPGARELVGALAGTLPLAIASGALHAEIEAILTVGGLRSAFAAVVGAEDAPRGKPDPAPYLAAVARLRPLAPGLVPEECLALEDSMAGIASARAAGLTVVGVAHSYPPAKLRAAHRVVDSLVELDVDGLRGLFRR